MRTFLFAFLICATLAPRVVRAEETLFDAGPSRSVAAPLNSDLERPRATANRAVETNLRETTIEETLPSSRDGDTAIAIAGVIALILRGLVGILKSPILAGVWGKIPLIAQWIVIGLFTALLAAADTAATGVPWKTSLVTAMAGWFTSWASQKLQKTDRKVNPHGKLMQVTGPGVTTAGLVILAFLSSPVHAQEQRRKTDQSAVSESLGAVDRNSGWCDNATTSATNIWASSNVPAEVGGDVDSAGTAAGLLNRSFIRFISITLVDQTDIAIPVCVRLGPNDTNIVSGVAQDTQRVGLTCVGTAGAEATNGTFLPAVNTGRGWRHEVITNTATPKLFILASATGTSGVRYCVEVTWHQKG